MSDTTFVPGTVVQSSWLNDVNRLTYDLGGANGSNLVGWVQNQSNAVARKVQDKLLDQVSVLDFMTTAQIADVRSFTGSIDVTTPIANAIAAVFTSGTKGAELVFPPGKYLGQLAITGLTNNSLGENGLSVKAYGAILKGRAADTSVIQVNGAVQGVDPAPGSSAYANGLSISGFTLDMSAMAVAANVYGVAIQRSYNSSLRDIHVIGEPNPGGGLYLGNNVYTYAVENFNCTRVKIHGYNNSTNMTSTISFWQLVAGQVVADNCFSLAFFAPTIQGGQDHFVLSDAQAISILGGDLEGTGGVVYNFGTNVRNITSRGNSVGGYTNTTYSSGIALQSCLEDRPPLSGGIGTYGRVRGSGTVSLTSTGTATSIYKFSDTTSGNGIASFHVFGDDGVNAFVDTVNIAYGVVDVERSHTLAGIPGVRTYTFASDALKVSLATLAAQNIRCLALEYLL